MVSVRFGCVEAKRTTKKPASQPLGWRASCDNSWQLQGRGHCRYLCHTTTITWNTWGTRDPYFQTYTPVFSKKHVSCSAASPFAATPPPAPLPGQLPEGNGLIGPLQPPQQQVGQCGVAPGTRRLPRTCPCLNCPPLLADVPSSLLPCTSCSTRSSSSWWWSPWICEGLIHVIVFLFWFG